MATRDVYLTRFSPVMTRIDPNLASLCMAILAGERDVHLILADVFEESGSPKAQSIRDLKSSLSIHGCRISQNLSDPFKLVLHALPETACWALMCDFAEHVLALYESRGPASQAPRRAIELRRQWLNGKASDEEVEAARAAAWTAGVVAASSSIVPRGIVPSEPPNEVASNAARSAGCSGGGDARAAALFTARYARLARRQTVLEATTGLDWQEIYRQCRAVDEDEHQWQLSHLRQFLTNQLR
jgi:hypothetical protein